MASSHTRASPFEAGQTDSPIDHKQQFIINHCQLRSSEPIEVYVPVLNPTYEDQPNLIRKFDIGERNMFATEKVILFVGATGSGKTTLINALFNYIFGVKWNDSFRLRLIEENVLNQAEPITKYISSYTIHHQQGFNVPYTITMIDTPGFGDTQGIKRDQEITQQIRAFFSTAGPNGIDRLDAVAFVAQSFLARLTPSQKYIFESILALFGKDVENCIMLLLTFADGPKPQILDSIEKVKLPHRKHLKFNNSALFTSNKGDNDAASLDDSDDNKDDDTVVDKSFYERVEKSFKSLITEISKVPPTSLIQTKEVLDERMKLEISIEGIQKEIKLMLGKLERLATEVKVLCSHEEDLDRNRDFKYGINQIKWYKKKTNPGEYTNNCLNCYVTCHERCSCKNDDNKIKCWAMTNGYCRICPGKCFWVMHQTKPYFYVYEHEQQTLQGLKTRNEEVERKKLNTEQVVKKCANEFEAAHLEFSSLAEATRKSIQRLEKISLRQNPLFSVEHIDILIKSEKIQREPLWQKRVSQLLWVREKNVCAQQVMEEKLDPIEGYRRKITEERIENTRGVWTRVAEYLGQGFGAKLSIETKPYELQIRRRNITDSEFFVSNSRHQNTATEQLCQFTGNKSYLQKLDSKDERLKYKNSDIKKATEQKIKSDSSVRSRSGYDIAAKASEHGEYQHNSDASKLGAKSSSNSLPVNDQDKYILQNCREISKTPHVYMARCESIFQNNTARLKRVEIGKYTTGTHGKVIMMVGTTGAGKTRLINTLFNHIVGMKWGDGIKLCLIPEILSKEHVIQANSEKGWIIAYTIHHDNCFTIPYTITIIETPSYGDTSGIISDTEITEQMRAFFSVKGCHGINQLDAVAFVTPSSQPMMTPAQSYIFQSILGLFGKDIGENIFLMFTFADGSEPQAMSSIIKASLPYQKYYLFNNGDLYSSQMNSFREMFWNMGATSSREFLECVAQAKSKSLTSLISDKYVKALSARHLLEISKRITHEFERLDLGMHLGLEDYEITTVKYNNPNDFKMANYEMLQKWFATTSDSHTAMNELETALRKCKLNKIVTNVLLTDE